MSNGCLTGTKDDGDYIFVNKYTVVHIVYYSASTKLFEMSPTS